MVGQGNLERTWKSGILKLLAMTDYRKYAYVVQGKRMYFLASSPGTSSSLGVFLKGKNFLPGEQILPFKNYPQFSRDTVAVLRYRAQSTFESVKRYRKLKCNGKIREIQRILKCWISGNPKDWA